MFCPTSNSRFVPATQRKSVLVNHRIGDSDRRVIREVLRGEASPGSYHRSIRLGIEALHGIAL